MVDARKMLTEALAKLDVTPTLEQSDVNDILEPAEKAAKAAGEPIDELHFELIASRLVLNVKPSDWGTFYGPQVTRVARDGRRFDSPPLESITAECMTYWTARMNAARHPVLRARYADLVWDLSHKAIGSRAPVAAAQIAIDGYAEALEAYPTMPSQSWGNLQKRVIDLALSINDDKRLRTAVAANVAYVNANVEKDEREFRLRSWFAILQSIPPRRRPPVEFRAAVVDFRRRVETLDAEQAVHFDMDQYALPLADHYWSSQQPEEAKKVMRMYGAAVERMSVQTTMATLSVSWFRQLYELYLRFEMNQEAAQVLKRIQDLQPRVPDDLVEISTSHQIPKEQTYEWLNSLVTDDVDESFANLTDHFKPRIDDVRWQLEELKQSCPLIQMIPTTFVDHEGRAVAEVDPNDAEGKLIQQTIQNIVFCTPFLELGMRRLFEKHAIGAGELFARVSASPVWNEQRHAILRRGIDAFFAEDPIVAIHILVTEIENAVRIIASGLRLTLQKPNRMGGFDLKNLNDLLADETVTAYLTEDVTTYLRVVLTDRRGWNLRNRACHGILPATSCTQAASLQLLHIVLLLSAVRTEHVMHFCWPKRN